MNTAAFSLALAGVLTAGAVFAQNKPGPHELPPGSDPAAFQSLPELKGVVSWKTLGQVELVKAKDRYVPQYASGVSALDNKEVRLQGFMMPLTMGEQQSHFILSAMPQSCMFCMPGGPEQMVEVKTKKPVKYTFDPVILSGKMAVLKDDPTGIFYRLTEAVPVKP
jgi:uncharacterized protein